MSNSNNQITLPARAFGNHDNIPYTKINGHRILELNTFWRNVVGFIPAMLWAAFVAVLSLISASLVPKFTWKSLIEIDKLGHLVCYVVLGLLVFRGFFKLETRYRFLGLYVIVGCTMFGIVIELLQKWMHAGRQFEIPDILANFIGVLVAYCIFIFCLKTKYHGS
jgi:VanZ family protein